MSHSKSLPSRLYACLLLLGLLALALPAAAQTEATQLVKLEVELWSDYDRPAMLVLLSGELPASTILPATITIPVPPEADVHAVARFDESGTLISDVDYNIANGLLTLTTPASSFRVEYYAPYEVDGNTHSYQFEWTGDLSVEQVETTVQQPLAAIDISITPEPNGSGARGDGLNYHTLPPRTVGPGEPYTVAVSYTVEAPALSAPDQVVPGQPTGAAPVTSGSTGASNISPWWLLAALGVIVLMGGAWYLGRRQGSGNGRTRKPQPSRPDSAGSAKRPGGRNTPATSARYCHNCGQAARTGDAFCRNCGAALKK